MLNGGSYECGGEDGETCSSECGAFCMGDYANVPLDPFTTGAVPVPVSAQSHLLRSFPSPSRGQERARLLSAAVQSTRMLEMPRGVELPEV